MFTDLFGEPMPDLRPSQVVSSQHRRTVSPEAKRKQALRRYEESQNLLLFEEILDFLRAPLLSGSALSPQILSDRAEVALVPETGDEANCEIDPDIPYESWGGVWVQDRHNLKWSRKGILFLQNQVFWESLEELSLHNNEYEKWSVLKWIFSPALIKQYIFDERIAKSHCLITHERDHPFSFHNCCIAARLDENQVRDGVRRNIPAEIYEAVNKVVTYF
jgi:hypothetical protein